MTQFDAFTALTDADHNDSVIVHRTKTGDMVRIPIVDLLGGRMHGTNLVKNFPSIERADGAAPEWWDTVSGTLTEEDATGESIASPPHERLLKIVDGGTADAEIYQEFDVSVEPRLTASTSVISASAWVYIVSAGTVTLELEDTTDGSLGTEATSTAGSWVKLVVNDITLGTSDLRLVIKTSTASVTFYATQPTLHIGSTPLAWTERGIVYRPAAALLYGPTDPNAGGFQTIDTSEYTGTDAVVADLALRYNNSVASRYVYIDSGTGTTASFLTAKLGSAATSTDMYNHISMNLNDSQQFSWRASGVSGDTESLEIALVGYWRWE